MNEPPGSRVGSPSPAWSQAGKGRGWAAPLQPAPFLLLAFSFVAVPGNAFHISFPIFPSQPKVGSYWPSLSLLSLLRSTPHTPQMPMPVGTSLCEPEFHHQQDTHKIGSVVKLTQPVSPGPRRPWGIHRPLSGLGSPFHSLILPPPRRGKCQASWRKVLSWVRFNKCYFGSQ